MSTVAHRINTISCVGATFRHAENCVRQNFTKKLLVDR